MALRRQLPLDIRCPTCREPAGAPCLDLMGNPREPHKDRVGVVDMRNVHRHV